MDISDSSFLSTPQSKLQVLGGVSLVLGGISLVASSLGLGVLATCATLFPEAVFLSTVAAAVAGVSLLSTLALPLAIASGVLIITGIVFLIAFRQQSEKSQMHQPDEMNNQLEKSFLPRRHPLDRSLPSILSSKEYKDLDYSTLDILEARLKDWAESAEQIIVTNRSLLLRLAPYSSELKINKLICQDEPFMLALIYVNPDYLKQAPGLAHQNFSCP